MSTFRQFFFLLALAVGTLTAKGDSFTFAAMGCLPYARVPQYLERADALRDEINRRQPAFTVHLGDINAGNQPADDALFERMRDWFDTFDHPLIYTPGDNEWTDAHRPAIGGFDPLERLDAIRTHFFGDEYSRGSAPMALETQRTMDGFEKYAENARWVHGGVVFATVHVIGSRNNKQPEIEGAVEEFRARDAANIAWMRAAFARAREIEAPGLALFIQAQPFAWNRGRPGFLSGFEDFLMALEEETRAFAKPVLLVHADEHVYRLDSAIAIAQGREPLPNLMRLATFGDGDIHGVEVLVDPTVPRVFAPGPLVVPGQPRPGLRR